MGKKDRKCEYEQHSSCLSRRAFLLGSGTTTITLALASIPQLLHATDNISLRVTGYPRKKVGILSKLEQDVPIEFRYPHDHPNCIGFIVKLGEEASGGVGPRKDIVAFNSLCTHMGGGILGPTYYSAKYKSAGPCSAHLSVFDLRRHGMIVSGHATTTLPQIILKIEGDDIYATGVMGLIYGFADNKVAI